MRGNPRVSTGAKVKSGKASNRLLIVAGIFLLTLVIVAGGVWWLVGGNTFATRAQDIKNSASFPDASMPSCQDKPAKECILSVNPFTQKLFTQYGQPLGQTQTLDNITLRLDQVYADNNYIEVAYTLFQPEGVNLYPGGSKLAFENQPPLMYRGTGMAGGNDHAIALIEDFDASTLSQTTGEIKLRFEIPKITLEKLPPTPFSSLVTPFPPPTSPLKSANALPTSTIAPANTVAAQAAGEPISTQTSTGPFSLEFSVKLTPARILEPKQAVKGVTGTATLEKIVITPMTERLFFSGVKAEPDLRVELVAGNAAYTPGLAPNIQHYCGLAANNWVSCDFEPGSLGKRSDWQIVLRRGVDIPLPTYPPCPECAPPALPPTPQFSPTPVRPGGPWIFKVTL